MPRTITAEDSVTGGKVTFEWDGTDDPTDQDFDQIFREARIAKIQATPRVTEDADSLPSIPGEMWGFAKKWAIDAPFQMYREGWKANDPSKGPAIQHDPATGYTKVRPISEDIGEKVTTALTEGAGDDSYQTAIARPVVNTALSVATDPMNLLPFGALGKLGSKGAAIGFGAMAGIGGMQELVAGAEEILKADGNPYRAVEHLVQGGINGAMAYFLIGKLAMGKGPKEAVRSAVEEPTKIDNGLWEDPVWGGKAEMGEQPPLDASHLGMKPPPTLPYDPVVGPPARPAPDLPPLELPPSGPPPRAMERGFEGVKKAEQGRDLLAMGEPPPAPPVPSGSLEQRYDAKRGLVKPFSPEELGKMGEPPPKLGDLPENAGERGSFRWGTEKEPYPIAAEQAPELPWKYGPKVAEGDGRVARLLFGQAKADLPADIKPEGVQQWPSREGGDYVGVFKGGQLEAVAHVEFEGTRADILNLAGRPGSGATKILREHFAGTDLYASGPQSRGFENWMANPERGALSIGTPPGGWGKFTGVQKQKGPTGATLASNSPQRTPTLGSMAYEARRNFLMSGLTTVAKQISDLTSQPLRMAEKAIASGLSKERHIEEVGEHGKQLVNKNVLSKAWKAAVNTLQEGPHHDLNPHYGAPQIPGTAGKVIRTPQRASGAIDSFVKELSAAGAQASWAVRTAKARGLKGKAFEKEVSRLEQIPRDQLPESVQNELKREANIDTLTEELQGFLKLVNGARESHGLKWIFPFFQVSANLVKKAYQRTPLYAANIGLKVAQGDLKPGSGALADELAKPILGTAIMLPIMMAVKNGQITGSGSLSYQERYKKEATTGQIPRSIKIGNQWISYDSLGYTANLIGLAADIVEAQEEKDKAKKSERLWKQLLANLTPSTVRELVDLSFLVNTKEDHRFGGRFTHVVGNTLSGMTIPRVVSKAANAMDSTPEGKGVSRKVDGVGDYLKRDIPFLRESLPQLRSAMGEPVTRDQSPFERFAIPFQRSEVKNRPAERELLRLEAMPSYPKEKGEVMGPEGPTEVEFSQEERDEVLDAMKRAKPVIEQVISDPGWAQVPDWQKKRILQKIVSRFRTGVTAGQRAKKQRELSMAPPPKP